jgi:hypothetical protein
VPWRMELDKAVHGMGGVDAWGEVGAPHAAGGGGRIGGSRIGGGGSSASLRQSGTTWTVSYLRCVP